MRNELKKDTKFIDFVFSLESSVCEKLKERKTALVLIKIVYYDF